MIESQMPFRATLGAVGLAFDDDHNRKMQYGKEKLRLYSEIVRLNLNDFKKDEVAFIAHNDSIQQTSIPEAKYKSVLGYYVSILVNPENLWRPRDWLLEARSTHERLRELNTTHPHLFDQRDLVDLDVPLSPEQYHAREAYSTKIGDVAYGSDLIATFQIITTLMP